MKTQDEIKSEALRRITEQVRDGYKPVDSEERYDALLDELYQDKMEDIPPLRGQRVSRLIRENSPTDYRCGKVDWLDGEDIREFDGEEWDGSDLDEAKEAVEDALDCEISDKETEEGEAESAVEKAEERVSAASEEDSADSLDDAKAELEAARDVLSDVQSELVELNAILAAVKAYSF